MYRLCLVLLSVALLAALQASPSAAQTESSEPLQREDPVSASLLDVFVRDATTLVALPWQQDLLDLSTEQVMAIRGLAEGRQQTIQDLYEEIRMLFQTVETLDKPVAAREAYALYYDLAAHKAETLVTFHTTVEAMLDVLTEEQRARWEAELEAAAQDQGGR